jgi:SSS family solute:Na+ symporter
MNGNFALWDYIVFVLYAVVIIIVGLWVSREKKGHQKNTEDYFLAGKSLTWWAIGASLLAANISAEHFIAMSGSGFAIGLAIATYEWIAAIALIIVGKYFLPIFLEKKIYTMPQFLEQRFNKGVSTAMAVFWLLVYVFVNLTSVTYLGALALNSILGVKLMYGIIGLAVFSGIYSLYGGLKAVAWTDVIHVVFLIIGGLVTTYLGLNAVSGGEGFMAGLNKLIASAPDKFNMILERGQTSVPDAGGGTRDAFQDLPGLAVVVGAMWLTNFGYWGFNQYIIQRGLGAKSIKEAKRGLVFAGYLKLLVPLLVVIPGITAFVLSADIGKSDEAYPWLLANFVPAGLRGLAFAALAAAIVSSLSSMVNSTSTIFTMDIYKTYINQGASQKKLVFVGRIVAFVALLVAVLVAPQLSSLDQAFQYIQEYTGYIYPGVFVIFFTGLFWRQATGRAALWTAILTIPLGVAIKLAYPDMPFILRMGYVFILLALIMVGLSLSERGGTAQNVMTPPEKRRKMITAGYVFTVLGALIGIVSAFFLTTYQHLGLEAVYVLVTGFLLLGFILLMNNRYPRMHRKAVIIDPELFKTDKGFNIASFGIMVILFLLYFFFW